MKNSLRIIFFASVMVMTILSFGQYAGTYTVGGNNPDFLTLDSAFSSLSRKGVSGSVRLNLRSGTYKERVIINSINGASNTNMIKVAPDPKNKSGVILKTKNTSFNQNYMILINQGFIEFDSIDFRVDSTSTLGRIIDFNAFCEKLIFNSCTFFGLDTMYTDDDEVKSKFYSIIYNRTKVNSLQVINCSFHKGAYSINLDNPSGNYSNNTEIKYNRFIDPLMGAVNLRYCNSPVIQDNYISVINKESHFASLAFERCNSVIIRENQIYLASAYGAINMTYCAGSSKYPNLIANNFISLYDSTISIYNRAAISFDYEDNYSNIYFNTIFINNASPCIQINPFTKNAKCNINNNNFINMGGGAVLVISAFAKDILNELDYNNYYTEGPNLVKVYQGDNYIKDLKGLQKQFGKDIHSLSTRVKFKSMLDLHCISSELDSAAAPLSTITTDIDGKTRDLGKPDIGASEFNYFSNDMAVVNFEPFNSNICGIDSAIPMVIIRNFGTLGQKNIKVMLEIKNDSGFYWYGSMISSKTLQSKMTDTFRFNKINTASGGKYFFRAYTNLSSDEEKNNDTLDVTKVFSKLSVKLDVGSDTICSNTNGILGKNYPSGASIKWYDASTKGNLVSKTSSFQISNLKRDTVFYVTSMSQGVEKASLGAASALLSIPFGGVFFVIVPKVNMTIDSFASYFGTIGSQSVSVYYKKGNYKGFESLPNSWKFVDSVNTKSTRILKSASVPLKKGLSLIKDSSYAFYLYCQNPQIENINIATIVNSDMTISQAWGTDSLFGSIKQYKFAGQVYYSKFVDCESERVPYSVKVNSAPVVNLGKDTSYCLSKGEAVKLNAGFSYKSYSWSNTETTQSINVLKTGNYGVSVVDSNACVGNDNVSIIVKDKPDIHLGKDTVYCANDGIIKELDAGSGFSSYTWSNSQKTQKMTVTSAGKYSVVVKNDNACLDSDTINIISNPNPIINLGPDRILNPDLQIDETLDAGPGFKTYEWSNLAKTQSIKVNKEGVYFVKVTDHYGCEGANYVTIRYWLKGNTSLKESIGIRIFPNPAKSVLNIVSENAVVDRMEVMEISGKSVYRSFEITRNFELNTSNWANGIYYISLSSEGKTSTFKFTVQH